jgi:hypothetical protein
MENWRNTESIAAKWRKYFSARSIVFHGALARGVDIAKIGNVKVISLEQAPEGYKSFDAGVANKFVIDPHGQLPKAA